MENVNIVVKDVRNEISVRRKVRIENCAAGSFQFLNLSRSALVNVKLAREAEENARAVAGEFVIRESADADARAFATGFLFRRKIFFGAFQQLFGRKEKARLFGGDVEFVKLHLRHARFGAQK